MGHSDIAVTLNVYTHVGLEDAEKELQKMQGVENARKEMGISDTDDKDVYKRQGYGQAGRRKLGPLETEMILVDIGG